MTMLAMSLYIVGCAVADLSLNDARDFVAALAPAGAAKDASAVIDRSWE
jgi:hypothetical protein